MAPLLDEVCTAFYGPAADPLRQYFAVMDEAIRQVPYKVEWGQKDYPASSHRRLWTPAVPTSRRQGSSLRAAPPGSASG